MVLLNPSNSVILPNLSKSSITGFVNKSTKTDGQDLAENATEKAFVAVSSSFVNNSSDKPKARVSKNASTEIDSSATMSDGSDLSETATESSKLSKIKKEGGKLDSPIGNGNCS